MDTTKLRYFVEAAECGSFTEAARRLYTSQPNISKQISALETELGARLFIRENRRVRLTRSGEYLFEQLHDLPGRLDQVFETARALGRGDAGELTVGLLAGQSLNADIMERFNVFTRQYPQLRYSLERAGFAALREALTALRYDMIITLAFDVLDDPALEVETIRHQAGAVFVSRMSPISEMEDFSHAPFVAISPKESYGGYSQLLRFCRSRGFEPNIVRLAESLDSLLFYVEAGVGVTILDRNTRLETDRNIRVIPVPESEPSDVVAVWPRTNANPNVKKLVDCLRLTDSESK